MRAGSRRRPNNRINVAFNSASDRAKLLSADECEAVIRWAKAHAADWTRECKTVSADVDDVFKMYSIIGISHDSKDKDVGWLPRRFADKLTSMNPDIWDFDIDEMSDVFILRYGVNDHFDLHMDLGEGYWDRKLSMLVQLSAPDSYEGGALEFGFGPAAVASREQGSLLVFPAWVPHRVTPITSGTRYIAGCFALGPSFR